MAFPVTGLIDDFNRTNATDLGANWTDNVDGQAATSGWRIVSNHAEMDNAFFWESSYYDVSTFGPDCEVYYTALHTPGGNNRILQFWRVTTPGASGTMYAIRWGATADATLHGTEKTVAGVNSNIGADWNQTLAAGDTLGVEMIGTSIQAYRKASGGSWATTGAARTDSSITAAGYIGLMARDSSPAMPQLDDFSGGTILGVAPPTNIDTSNFPRFLLAGRKPVYA